MSNLFLRSISGLIYVALVIGALLAGPIWAIALFSIFGVVSILEFRNITEIGKDDKTFKTITAIVDIVFFLSFCAAIGACVLYMDTDNLLRGAVTTAGCVVFVLPYLLLRMVLALFQSKGTALKDLAWSVFGLIYIFTGIISLCCLCASPLGCTIALIMFAMIWLNDTGAYCTGSLFGKHPMWPRLSPKKSWEGFAGGLAFCMIAGAVTFFATSALNLTLVAWVVYGIIVCAFSTWGDLFESLIKRTLGIKDSGNIIPGHGGILDRIDSLLFVAPITLILFIIVTLINY